ncbi:MAG: response regulator [Lachnospiraceae bacterium]|nr:response regulator [Lachnospiraceae bacterium]
MPLHLLIIDDSELNLKLTEIMLSKIKCQTDTFSDVREALRSVRDHDYDLVFMDYLMPDINGVEATRLIRSMEGGVHSDTDYYKKLPIVALTAEEDSSLLDTMTDSGVNDILFKPFKIEDVCAVLDKWCATDLKKTLCSQKASSDTGSADIECSDIPDITGISPDALREILKIDRDGFIEALDVFTKDLPGKHYRINEALSREDYETYCVEVHRIKGESALIGAYRLSEASEHLNILGKSLARKTFAPDDYETILSSILTGTAAMFKSLDDLCSSANTFLTDERPPEDDSDVGVMMSLSELTNKDTVSSEKKVDNDKIIRYIAHAREALDSGDADLAKEWLVEISEHIKK